MDLEFEELKREFLNEADEKIREVRTALEREFPPSREDLERMIYLAHQLKGAGGSYGFQVISTESAALESELERLSRGGGDDVRSRLQERAERISTVISERARDLAVR
jgi:HPt (histidine-containing phosphotransfer) domain-containing protein